LNSLSAKKIKTVMVVAGGEWQVPLICKAKEAGYRVINTNLYENSPGFSHADIGLITDVRDKQQHLDYALQYRPDAIVTDQSDIAVPTVAYLCHELGLPGIGVETAEKFTNKFRMREVCGKEGFPTPRFALCLNKVDAYEFIEHHGYPVVIKPPANQSSRGVFKLNSPGELEAIWDITKSFSADGSVLLEEFIGGVELTVDGIKTDSRHYCLATSTKTHYPHNSMVASRLVFSNAHPEIDFAELHAQHDALIEKMGLPFGLTHAEYKYHNERFYLVEVAARGGGTRVSSDIVPLISGIDSNELLIRMALGEQIAAVNPSFSDNVVALDFLQFEAGYVNDVTGHETSHCIPGIIALGLNFSAGDEIAPPNDDRSRHGYVIASAPTRSKLDETLQQIRNTIRVKYA